LETHGTKLIKEFFSEAMKTIRKMISTLEIKKILQNIEEEDEKPLPDDQLAELLKKKGTLREEPLNIRNN
jgi:RNA polymerase sigma-54 factor